MKFKNGYLHDEKSGMKEDMIVDSRYAPIPTKKLIFGTIGIITGITYLMRESFNSGAKATHTAFIKASDKLEARKKEETK